MKKNLIILFCVVGYLESHPSVFDDISPENTRDFVRNIFVDSYHIGQELCSQRTLKIVSGFIPFFLIGRHYDKRMHACFYDAANHQNKHQPPQWLQYFAEYEIMDVPIWVCRFFAFGHRDRQVRRAFQIFTLGYLCAHISKLIIKQTVAHCKLDVGLRPLHPGFSREWKHYHGIPSGHAIVIAFTATYLGLYKGWHYGVPFGLYTGFIMGMRVAGNHHFISQVVTGTALGIIWGASSYAVFEKIAFPENISVNVVTDTHNQIGVSVGYNF